MLGSAEVIGGDWCMEGIGMRRKGESGNAKGGGGASVRSRLCRNDEFRNPRDGPLELGNGFHIFRKK
jgi:hypothetical protein